MTVVYYDPGKVTITVRVLPTMFRPPFHHRLGFKESALPDKYRRVGAKSAGRRAERAVIESRQATVLKHIIYGVSNGLIASTRHNRRAAASLHGRKAAPPKPKPQPRQPWRRSV